MFRWSHTAISAILGGSWGKEVMLLCDISRLVRLFKWATLGNTEISVYVILISVIEVNPSNKVALKLHDLQVQYKVVLN